jgi:hypothetical protein
MGASQHAQLRRTITLVACVTHQLLLLLLLLLLALALARELLPILPLWLCLHLPGLLLLVQHLHHLLLAALRLKHLKPPVLLPAARPPLPLLPPATAHTHLAALHGRLALLLLHVQLMHAWHACPEIGTDLNLDHQRVLLRVRLLLLLLLLLRMGCRPEAAVHALLGGLLLCLQRKCRPSLGK